MSKAKQQPSRAELLNHIRGSFLFKDLREDILEELSHDLVWVSLEPGEYLSGRTMRVIRHTSSPLVS